MHYAGAKSWTYNSISITGNYHVGQPMLIDLNLGLDRQKTEILMVELFNKFDRDGSGILTIH